MARVVQRRTNPPYLLILFVFLFLLATSLAVLFYINWDKSVKELTAEKSTGQRLMSPADEDAAIKAMRDNAIKNPNQTIVSQLKRQVEHLAAAISPDKPTYETAKAALDQTRDKYKDYTSLITLVDRVSQEAARNQARVDELVKERNQLVADKGDLSKEKDALAKKQLDDLAKLTDQLKQLDEKFKGSHGDYQSKLSEVTDQINKKVADYEKNINDKLKTIADMKADIAKKDTLIAEQRDKIARLQVGGDVFAANPKPDGKITLVMDSDKIAYVNIGAKDGVKVGLTLAVYPFTGITEEGNQPKGKLRVVNVYPENSECMITYDSLKDPIGVNDLVSNLAFDASRTFTFLVDGMFDLRGTGTPSPNGLEEAKQLIVQSGGKLTDELDIQCDFVVLGEPPAAPVKPAETEVTPQVEKVYREQLKALEHYNDIKKQATDLKIPILNTNRFLALMGYVAPKVNK